MNNRNALKYYDAGFKTLISVVPPDGQVADHSKVEQKDAGKVPGRMNQQGEYVGYNWMQHQPERHEVHQWLLDGSNVGIGAWDFPAIDIDVTDEHLAKLAIAAVEGVMGPCVVRRGRYPKALLIFRSNEPLRSFDVRYEGEHENPLLGRVRHLIQFLGQGRQYVIDGIHPGTGQPYTVEDPRHAFGLLGAQALPVLTVEKVTECFEAIARVYEEAGYSANISAQARLTAEEVPQEELKAPDINTLKDVVAAIPNDTPDRDEYISVGYAIRGASQDDPAAGLDIFQEWCSRWTDGHNDPELVEQDWGKMSPPYRTGYDWLLSKGSQWGANMAQWSFGRAEEPPLVTEDEESSRQPGNASFTEFDLADEFLSLYGDKLRTLEDGSGDSYYWSGTHWEKANRNVVELELKAFLQRKAKQIPFLVENDADQKKLIRWVNQTSTLKSLSYAVKINPKITVDVDHMDSDPDIINTPSGPYCLRTGATMEPKPSMPLYRITEVSPDPDVYCPLWQEKLKEWMCGDEAMIEYLQRLAGYCMTGHTREQVFPFFMGVGRNGKSIFVETLAEALGGYATEIPIELLQSRKTGGGENSTDQYHQARLAGARLAVTSETKTGGFWDEQKVKQLTGGDKMSARQPYGRVFSFSMKATLIAVGNYAPELQSVGESMTRRMHLVPWKFRPAVEDKMLREKLRAELPGILGWALEGAQKWYEFGLGKPEIVRVETDDYFFDQDTVGAWLHDCVTIEPAAADAQQDFATTKQLYDNYCEWHSLIPGRPYGYHKFVQLMGPRLLSEGAKRGRGMKGDGARDRGYVGVKLAVPQEHLPPNVSRFPAEPPAIPIASHNKSS